MEKMNHPVTPQNEPPSNTAAGEDDTSEAKPEEVPISDQEWSSSEEGLYVHMEDYWKIQDNQLIRQHVTPRITLFCPTNINTCPVPTEWLEETRQTNITTKDQTSWNIHDTWKDNIQAHKSLPLPWKGETIFTIKSQHLGHCPNQVEYNNLCHQEPTMGYEVALTLTMTEIQSCSQMSLGDQIVALASTAKKQRAEVREKELSPADLALFRSAKEKEIRSWLSTETVRKIARSQIPEEQILRSRWVLTWKPVEPTGGEENMGQKFKPKARLVILGYEDPQLESLARDSPTLGKDSRSLIFQYAASTKTKIRSFDIQTAFLRGSRQDGRILGMEPPAEMRQLMDLKPWECCELLKSAYGLVNAPLLWYEELRGALIRLNFLVSPLDPCLFVLPKKDGSGIHGLVGIHVRRWPGCRR